MIISFDFLSVMSEVLVRNLDEAVVEQLKHAGGSGPILAGRAQADPGTGSPSGANAAGRGREYRVLADRIRAGRPLGDGPQADSWRLLAEDRATGESTTGFPEPRRTWSVCGPLAARADEGANRT